MADPIEPDRDIAGTADYAENQASRAVTDQQFRQDSIGETQWDSASILDYTKQKFSEGQLGGLDNIATLAWYDVKESIFGIDEEELVSPERAKEQYGLNIPEPISVDRATHIADVRDGLKEAREWMEEARISGLGSTVLPFIGGLAGNVANASSLAVGVAAATLLTASTGGAALPIIAAIGIEAAFETGIEGAAYTLYNKELTGEEYGLAELGMDAAANLVISGGFSVVKWGGGKAVDRFNRPKDGGTPTPPPVNRTETRVELKDPVITESKAMDAGVKLENRKIPDTSLVEKSYLEDKLDGVEPGHKAAQTPEQLMTRKLHTVSKTLNPKKSADLLDMDIGNKSESSFIMTDSVGAAIKHAQETGNYVTSATIKSDAKIINYNQVLEPDQLKEIQKLLNDTTYTEHFPDATVGETIQYMKDRINNAKTPEDAAKRAAKLEELNAYLGTQDMDIAMETGGVFDGDNMEGKYEHTKTHVFNKEALENVRTEKPPEGGGTKIKERTVTPEDYQAEMADPTKDLDYVPEIAAGVKNTNQLLEESTYQVGEGTKTELEGVKEKYSADTMEELNALAALEGDEGLARRVDELQDSINSTTPEAEKSAVTKAVDFINCLRST